MPCMKVGQHNVGGAVESNSEYQDRNNSAFCSIRRHAKTLLSTMLKFHELGHQSRHVPEKHVPFNNSKRHPSGATTRLAQSDCRISSPTDHAPSVLKPCLEFPHYPSSAPSHLPGPYKQDSCKLNNWRMTCLGLQLVLPKDMSFTEHALRNQRTKTSSSYILL